jgi:ergothioneine biosynthesis protein EgtB
MNDGGYAHAELWLSDGWDRVCGERWRSPLYWAEHDGDWHEFTLAGLRPVDMAAPVCHVSYYEADAFARWAGARLPREEEWESAARQAPVAGNFLESGVFHPMPVGIDTKGPSTSLGMTDQKASQVHQLLGDAWEWTGSAYLGYPGYRPDPGALGEYNGKFMSGQMVLRGGSCATPASHIRATYRNFFPAHARWQFMGIRLANDGD